jgi:anti-sigma28 factor (negative regulator of flagellin synthesis)
MANEGTNVPQRKRSFTSLTLNWIADRVRHTQELKEKIASGAYKVDSKTIAASIVDPAKSSNTS